LIVELEDPHVARSIKQIALGLILATAWAFPALAADAKLVRIDTPRGAKQAFILLKPDSPPFAAAVLFAGGGGALKLKSATAMGWGAGNFLVRTRDKFVNQGLMVAVVDAPSDQQNGMNAIFRMSKGHVDDIKAVIAHLKKEANVPVWLVGTSMGTFSAASGAVNGAGADGVALTSTITRSKRDWKIASSHPYAVASMALDKVSVPALVMSHAKDGCDITPASDASRLRLRLSNSKRVEMAILDGGGPPRSDPCEAASQHGFLGIEDKAVGAIVLFIKSNGPGT